MLILVVKLIKHEFKLLQIYHLLQEAFYVLIGKNDCDKNDINNEKQSGTPMYLYKW